MKTFLHKMMALCVVLSLVCTVQVQSAPVPGEWVGLIQSAPVPAEWVGLIHRAKRSLLWRWNTLRAVGAGCREHSECATKYCRRNTCSFRVYSG